MKRTLSLRKPEERTSSKRNEYYYECDEFYNSAKRTKQEIQPRKENRKENKKVQPPKNLGELKTLKEENEKIKGIIEILEPQLARYKIENANAEAEVKLLQQENRKIQMENEKCKAIYETLEVESAKYKIESTSLQTVVELLKLENRKIQSENEKSKGTIEDLEAQLAKYKIEVTNVQTEVELLQFRENREIQSESKKLNGPMETQFLELDIENENDEEVANESCAANMRTSGAEAIASHDCLKYIPILESSFIVWDISLKEPNSFLTMMNFYLSINIKNENGFIKACIAKTFSKDFIEKIHFDSSSEFNDSNILLCLISKPTPSAISTVEINGLERKVMNYIGAENVVCTSLHK